MPLPPDRGRGSTAAGGADERSSPQRFPLRPLTLVVRGPPHSPGGEGGGEPGSLVASPTTYYLQPTTYYLGPSLSQP